MSSEVVESGMTVDLDRVAYAVEDPVDFAPPPGNGPLHVRALDLPSLALEARLAAKLDAVRAFARWSRPAAMAAAMPRAVFCGSAVTCG